ncbi:hypothetical protein [Pseudonocardia lacus]|uniref:hypothetical protein n=1 Tax=Pseudonocardia lacus TaxID=2835865 RepID=UPI002028EECC|nr:hypothetical protein [Pseudonocardia lacus]
MPDVVVEELRRGAAMDGRIQAVLDAPWIEHRELVDPLEVATYAKYAALLVSGDRNRGEAGVLALATTMNGVAIVDDGVARNLAGAHGVRYRPTLALLCEAIRQDLLTAQLVSALADDLIRGKYRLPFAIGQFEVWASENGLIA